MPPQIQDNMMLIVVAAAAAYAIWKCKQSKKVAPATQQEAVAPVYIQSPAPLPDLVDLHINFQDRREREVKRQLAEKKLDQMALYEETLRKVGEVLTPPSVGPKS